MLVFRMLCRITQSSDAHRTDWVSDNDGSRTDNVREFQSVGPETAKHLRPYLIVLERGTARSPRTAERRWPRLADSEIGEHSSARYEHNVLGLYLGGKFSEKLPPVERSTRLRDRLDDSLAHRQTDFIICTMLIGQMKCSNLAECWNFIAMAGYCHNMSSVVCLSACPSSVYLSSVTRVYCDKTAEAKIMHFSLKYRSMP